MIKVAILGATGTVGQKFISLLKDHPYFTIHELVASERSAGKSYSEACIWKQAHPIPSNIAEKKILSLQENLESAVVFSGLDSSVAYEAERDYAEAGHIVISNSRNHRMEALVPLVIPEINHTHLDAITQQGYKGGIVTNPNCSTMAMSLPLAPLHKEFGISRLIVHTMQAISGAGYPGVASMDILGNVVPYISGEEEKMESEPQKIFGSYSKEDGFVPAEFVISAHCNRVAVIDGHTENISIEFSQKPTKQQILDCWRAFKSYPQEQILHSAPVSPVWYLEDDNRPQSLLDLWNDKGMASSVGRLRDCNIFDYKFTVFGHNTVRGAAGAAILNAETMLSMGLL